MGMGSHRRSLLLVDNGPIYSSKNMILLVSFIYHLKQLSAMMEMGLENSDTPMLQYQA
jgi:hypothetical protein